MRRFVRHEIFMTKEDKSNYRLKADTGPFKLVGHDVRMTVRTPLPKEHPFYALIGRVASNWTLFEHTLDLIIWDLAKIPQPTAVCLTGQMMGATTRFKIIEALGRQIGLSKSDLQPVRTLKTSHYEVIEKRNRIVHDPWFMTFDTDDGTSIGEVSQWKVSGHTKVDESEIQETLDRIQGLIDSARNLRRDLLEAESALRGKR